MTANLLSLEILVFEPFYLGLCDRYTGALLVVAFGWRLITTVVFLVLLSHSNVAELLYLHQDARSIPALLIPYTLLELEVGGQSWPDSAITLIVKLTQV
jgi:hypothetical protein